MNDFSCNLEFYAIFTIMTRDAFDFQIIFEIQTQHNYVVSMPFQMKPDCNLIKFNNENILFCFFLGVESFKLTS